MRAGTRLLLKVLNLRRDALDYHWGVLIYLLVDTAIWNVLIGPLPRSCQANYSH